MIFFVLPTFVQTSAFLTCLFILLACSLYKPSLPIGDIAFRFIEGVRSQMVSSALKTLPGNQGGNEETSVVVCDINSSMLEVGRDRAIARGFATEDGSTPKSM